MYGWMGSYTVKTGDDNMKFRCAGLTNDSIVDGPGLRFTIWTQGCEHHCPSCHNPQTWDMKGGYEEDTDSVVEKIKNNPMLDGVTLSGGDPFYQAKAMADIAGKIHAETNLNVIAYTGFTYEQLIKDSTPENGYLDLLKECDYLIDGPFVLAQRSLELKFRGSRNQRFIDVKRSLKENSVIELSDEEVSNLK